MRSIVLYIGAVYFTLFLLCEYASAQEIHGHVMSEEAGGEMSDLPGASVMWLGTLDGVIADTLGAFVIKRPDSSYRFLRISYVGYLADTADIKNKTFVHIMLKPGNALQTVTVQERDPGTTFSTISPVSSEILGSAELKKAACCTLSESFENNNSVDAEYTDAISGAKTIRLLGLDGVYAQIMTENIPEVRGLMSSYGLTFLPGQFMRSIQVNKGAGSVVNGYESITGAINAEYKKPDDPKEFFLTLNGTTSGQGEVQLDWLHPINKKLSTGLYAYTKQMHFALDDNHDSFLDMPLTENYFLMSRWKYNSMKKYQAFGGITYIASTLKGGQLSYIQSVFDPSMGYGVNNDMHRVEGYLKNGWVFDKPGSSLGLILNGSIDNTKSRFGEKIYEGNEQYFNANCIFQTYLFNTSHHLKAGASWMHDGYNESYDNSAFLRNENVPGVFAEYFFQHASKFSVLAGFRLDFHNLYGTFWSPRLHVKYSPELNTTFRFSAGKGYRTANIFTENPAILASSRELVLTAPLQPEEAWNFGFSITRFITISEEPLTFTLDVYDTEFKNQVIADLDRDPQYIYIANLEGRSFAHVLQAEADYAFKKWFTIRFAWKVTDARETLHDKLLEIPLTAHDRGLANLELSTPKGGWQLDLTLQYIGPERLPDTRNNPELYRLSVYGPGYEMLLGQITKKFRYFELYAGSDNLTNYTQKRPVLASEDPYGAYFDASILYAPIMRRTWYAGLRLTLH